MERCLSTLRCHGVQLSLLMLYAQMRGLDHTRTQTWMQKGLIYWGLIYCWFCTHIYTQTTHYLCLFGFQYISLAAKESTAAQLQAIKMKYEEAAELRRKTEVDNKAFLTMGFIEISNICQIIQITSNWNHTIVMVCVLQGVGNWVDMEFLKPVYQQVDDSFKWKLHNQCAPHFFWSL